MMHSTESLQVQSVQDQILLKKKKSNLLLWYFDCEEKGVVSAKTCGNCLLTCVWLITAQIPSEDFKILASKSNWGIFLKWLHGTILKVFCLLVIVKVIMLHLAKNTFFIRILVVLHAERFSLWRISSQTEMAIITASIKMRLSYASNKNLKIIKFRCCW